MSISTDRGVYKQWTGLLEWWNSGMVDWIVFHFRLSYGYPAVSAFIALYAIVHRLVSYCFWKRVGLNWKDVLSRYPDLVHYMSRGYQLSNLYF